MSKPPPVSEADEFVELNCPHLENAPRFSDADRAKLCDVCDKVVHNLSALTRPQADALLAEGADYCVTYRSDATGEAVFQPTGFRRYFRPVASAAAVLIGIFASTGCTDEPEPPPPPVTVKPEGTKVDTKGGKPNGKVGTQRPHVVGKTRPQKKGSPPKRVGRQPKPKTVE
jgi:hypothetical protein